MTFRERLEQEYPEKVDSDCLGGCFGCPHEYGYEDFRACDFAYDTLCRQCWDREIGEQNKITNADRVRFMTDEELEQWFWWMHREMMNYTDSVLFVHDWLKQEVDE